MSSPENRPGEDDERRDEEPATARPGVEHTDGGLPEDGEARPTEGAGTEADRPDAGPDTGGSDADRADAGGPDAEGAGSLTSRLAPIPPEGTAAPADATRVFGQPPPSSPYARILAGDIRGGRTGVPGAGAGAGTPGAGPAGPHRGAEPGSRLSEEDVRRLRNRGRYALALGFAGLLASVIAFPLGPILGIAAIVLGLSARRAAREAQVSVPGAKPGIVLGIVATALSTILLATMVVFWDEATEYQRCMSGANTQTAREACQERLMERITERVAPAGTTPR